jgi:hypothetical protein
MPAASGAPVFVHFMPLPLRAEGKKNLPWIVHTSDGSGCHEADHVLFKTLIGFETFEGCPPDQGSCKCTVSNHHLRGHGRVRWEGATAVIECADDDENKLVNVASFRDDAKRQAREVTSIRADLRRLKEEGDKASVHTGNLKARVTELERTKLEYENGPMREHEVRPSSRWTRRPAGRRERSRPRRPSLPALSLSLSPRPRGRAWCRRHAHPRGFGELVPDPARTRPRHSSQRREHVHTEGQATALPRAHYTRASQSHAADASTYPHP